jgi:hypothetical protein
MAAGPQDCKTARPQDRKTARPQDCKTARPQDRKTAGPQDNLMLSDFIMILKDPAEGFSRQDIFQNNCQFLFK